MNDTLKPAIKDEKYLSEEANLLRKVRESFTATFPGFNPDRIRPAQRYGDDDPAVLIDDMFIITARGHYGWDTLPEHDPNPRRYFYDGYYDYLGAAIERACVDYFTENQLSMPGDVDEDE
jgi:hypothetical protein